MVSLAKFLPFGTFILGCLLGMVGSASYLAEMKGITIRIGVVIAIFCGCFALCGDSQLARNLTQSIVVGGIVGGVGIVAFFSLID